MSAFDFAAILVTVAAVSGLLNYKFLKLPPTSGTLAVTLVCSLLLVALDAAVPQLEIRAAAGRFLGRIDFNRTLMQGMLAFLLFAAAFQLNLQELLENRLVIGTLATMGVVMSTAIVGSLMWWFFAMVHTDVPFNVCLVFGALISPTDPVAVMALLKELRAPRGLEAQIGGESLFNDGVGVVIFTGLVAMAGLQGDGPPATGAMWLLAFFAREVAGGAALGLGFGYLAYRTLKGIDNHSLELLITIALAMTSYATAFRIHVSGPIAVVFAGLVIGNPARQFAMNTRTREHVSAFWDMTDDILNAVLFLLLGLEVFAVPTGLSVFAAGLFSVAVALLARLISVGVPVVAIGRRAGFGRGIIPVLTWSGLRGGLAVAMMLSLPPFPARELLLACTYSVVVFSLLVQGPTVRRVLLHYGIGGPANR